MMIRHVALEAVLGELRASFPFILKLAGRFLGGFFRARVGAGKAEGSQAGKSRAKTGPVERRGRPGSLRVRAVSADGSQD